MLKLFLTIAFFTVFQTYINAEDISLGNVEQSLQKFVNSSLKEIKDELAYQIHSLVKIHDIFDQRIKKLTDDNLALNSTLLGARKQLQDSEEDVKKQLNNLKENPVPIGFIYVQLPNEKSPTEIWSWMTWKDVSSAYAGVFFRVVGGNASSFGEVQDDNAPHLTGAAMETTKDYHDGNSGYVTTNIGGDSDWIVMGDYIVEDYYRKIRFSMSGGEVRPRNMAIRIWKRSG